MDLGFITSCRNIILIKELGTTKSFNFLHFTMQEFLAALHVSTLPSETTVHHWWRRHFGIVHYNFMWMMFCWNRWSAVKRLCKTFVSKGQNIQKEKWGLEWLKNILSDKRKRLHVFPVLHGSKKIVQKFPDVISDMFKDGKGQYSRSKNYSHITFSSLMSYMSQVIHAVGKTLELKWCKIYSCWKLRC